MCLLLHQVLLSLPLSGSSHKFTHINTFNLSIVDQDTHRAKHDRLLVKSNIFFQSNRQKNLKFRWVPIMR